MSSAEPLPKREFTDKIKNTKMDSDDVETKYQQSEQQKLQQQMMDYVDQNAGYGFRLVGRMPRVKVYMTHLTRFKPRKPQLVGTFKTKRAAHKRISEICNPKEKKDVSKS